VEPRLHRPGRDVEASRDLLERQIVLEAQEHHDPVIGVEASQRVDEFTIAGRLADPRMRFSFERDRSDALALARAETIAAAVDEDPIEPGAEPIGVPQGSSRAPRGEAGVLDGILGLDIVEQDRPGEPIRRHESALDQSHEGVGPIGRDDGFHELLRIDGSRRPSRRLIAYDD
jgi:hypothetical protein